MTLRIYTCPEWGARAPKAEAPLTRKAARIIFHHTAGHHAEISNPANESLAEAFAYARAIQRFHMDGNGWNDSGHNFLVTQSGVVLQGRWHTVTAIESRLMVVSAHCPGQNDQIGVEHEHADSEAMTAEQAEAAAQLQAWIAQRYAVRAPLPVFPHSKFFATSCPANLAAAIVGIRDRAADILTGA